MKTLMHLVDKALAQAGLRPDDTVVVAASGGCDSTALLHLIHALGRSLVVAHVDHGARGAESDGDREFVENWALSRGLIFETMTLDAALLKTGPQGFQGEARKRRMAWLEDVRVRHGAAAIATGHHADDQAETWLLHAMRSVHPWAVQGMALREGYVVRPLLEITREELRTLALKEGWVWREDASNASDAYVRNRIRNEVLPLLDEVRPGTTKHLTALAKRAADLHEVLTPLLDRALKEAQAEPASWDIDVLQRNPLSREAWRREFGNRGWSDALASQALGLVDAQIGAHVQGPDARVVRERNRLVETVWSHDSPAGQSVRFEPAEDRTTGSVTNALGECHWTAAPAPTDASKLSLASCWIPASWLPVTLRTWRDGDRIQPLGMEGHSLVSDVLTQAKVPHAWRHEALVLERTQSGDVLWVAGHKCSERARLHLDQLADAPGLQFTFEPAQES